ncbi:MAG: magnesium chelatase domain-containing protein, partial [Proteocatella sp.]
MNYTCALDGIDGYTVSVEADISKGIPNFSIVGLPDVSVKESRERIKSAITNSNLKFPNKKIVINLSPSDIRKEGSHFDLAIAICILSGEYCFLKERYEKTAFVGGLSLNGKISAVKGVIPFIVNAKLDKNLDKILVPFENYEEAQVVDNIDIYPVSDIKQVLDYLCGKIELDKMSICESKYNHEFSVDYMDIKGNLVGKRAAEICASGRHNLLLIGSAGSGKTMIAKRLISIMGELTEKEYLEVSRIYSSAGLFNEDILKRIRPFRSPHHTATIKSIIGGGQTSTPGEV